MLAPGERAGDAAAAGRDSGGDTGTGAVGYWLFAMPPERFADRMREAVCVQKDARIAVGDFTDFPWDELVVVDSQGDPRAVEKALGVPFGDAFLRPGAGRAGAGVPQGRAHRALAGLPARRGGLFAKRHGAADRAGSGGFRRAPDAGRL